MITGGSALGLESKRQRKAYVRVVSHVAVQFESSAPKYSSTAIMFGPEDARGLQFPHQDPLVISVDVAQCLLRRVLVDGGSSADVIFLDAFRKMQIPMDRLTRSDLPLLGFGGQPITAVGKIPLQVVFGEGSNNRVEDIIFDVVDVPYQYNAILGRSTINKSEAVIHHNYLTMKMPGPTDIIVVSGEQCVA